MWQTEAWAELGKTINQFDHQRALFPKRFYERVEQLDHNKTHDFCFIGAFKIDVETASRRKWLEEFIRANFTASSYLQFTDSSTKKTHVSLGAFDHTHERNGFVPKEVPVKQRNFFDEHYYQIMCHSKFTLCPAGDRLWSMRFYEALMCKSVPVLERRWHHRSIREAIRGYKYYTKGQALEFRNDWIEENYRLFLKHHTLRSQCRR